MASPESQIDALILHRIFRGGDIFQVHRRGDSGSRSPLVVGFGIVQLPLRLQQESTVRPSN